MVEVFNKSREKLAILQNAYGISENVKLNAVSDLTFTLPLSDPKAQYCQPFNLIRYNENDFYRIAPFSTEKTDVESVTYTCEHVICSLIDTLMFGYHVVGNIGVYTADVIKYILSKQKNWVLGECDFRRQFEYGFEQENLLGALFSVPKPLAEKYIWTFNFDVFPWVINLKKLEESGNPQLYVRSGKNMISLHRPTEVRDICTKLYPLGAGEGVNQVSISTVNNGVPYLQSPPEILEKYGIIERVFIDRRYENANSLLQIGKAMLLELQEPHEEYQVDYVHVLGEVAPQIGMVVKVVDNSSNADFKSYITEIQNVHDDVTASTIILANKPQDIAGSIADLADRQRIEMTYSQGATQIYSNSLNGNADTKSGLILDFFLPEDMPKISNIVLKIRMSSFRAFSSATSGGGGNVATSSSSGYTVATTSSNGETHKSTDSGGGSYTTTSSGGGDNVSSSNQSAITYLYGVGTYTDVSNGHNHYYNQGISAVSDYGHSHWVMIREHSHSIQIQPHYHGFSIPNHAHNIQIQAHQHTVNVPTHTHGITPGIFFFGSPQSMQIFVEGQLKSTFNTCDVELDIAKLLVNEDGIIQRGKYHSIEIRPNDLAYITATVTVKGFVQSRGDTTY